MLAQQTTEYFQQMENSIGDKRQIWSHIVGEKVLDAGCGSGLLTKALLESGFDAKGIDSSLIAFNMAKANGMEKHFIHGDLRDMNAYFRDEKFDTIIFSSVLHEVYSYGGIHGEDNLWDTIISAYDILSVGGRIIIRDGVKPSYARRIIRFKNINDVLFLKEYCRRFPKHMRRRIPYATFDNDPLAYGMSEADAMEFLYTYTWGWESFDREVQEQYGVYTLADYCHKIQENLPYAKIKLAESYLQSGYRENLYDKIDFLDESFTSCKLPDSNMIIVVEKSQ